MEDKQKNDMIALLDQFNTHLENMGSVMSNLYHSLINNGVPESLAGDLVIDW